MRHSVRLMKSIPRGKGFSRHTDQEFTQFLHIAKGSVAELQSQLYIATCE